MTTQIDRDALRRHAAATLDNYLSAAFYDRRTTEIRRAYAGDFLRALGDYLKADPDEVQHSGHYDACDMGPRPGCSREKGHPGLCSPGAHHSPEYVACAEPGNPPVTCSYCRTLIPDAGWEQHARRHQPISAFPVHPTNLDEVDRNARAYGWEVGRGADLRVSVPTSAGNPFVDKAWRDAMPAGADLTCGHAQTVMWGGVHWVHPMDMGVCDRPPEIGDDR